MYSDYSPLRQFFSQVWVRIMIIVDILIIVATAVIAIYNGTKTSTIDFTVTPVDSTISVNGNSQYHNGSFRVHPGSYEVTIAREGFVSKTFSVEVSPDSTGAVTTFLSADDGSFDFYEQKENAESLAILGEIASKGDNVTTDHDISAEDFIAEYDKNLAFLNSLPIVEETPTGLGLDAGVNYQYDVLIIEDGRDDSSCTRDLCIRIIDTIGGREAYALSILRGFGFEESAFQIVYQEEMLDE